MPSRINYKEGDVMGNCIFIKETEPVTYKSPHTGKVCIKRNGLFECKCGNTFETEIMSVKMQNTRSCGCIIKNILKTQKFAKTHGLHSNPLYHIQKSIIYRCNDVKNKAYKNYGARGIKLCERWNDLHNFIDDMYPTYKEGLEIDRIDNNGNYEPGNCRWVTHAENNNNRTNNRKIEYKGEIKTLRQWSDYLNIKYSTLAGRLNYLSVDESFTKPVEKRSKR